MPHRQPKDLIDALIDQELDEETAKEVRRQLEQDPALKQELDFSTGLKNFLNQFKTPDPGEPYWDEVTSLILAKTTDQNIYSISSGSYREAEADKRRSFYRSLISVAASLFIFFSALLIGSSQNQPIHLTDTNPGVSNDVTLVSESSAEKLDIITPNQRLNLAKGLMMLSPPGRMGGTITIAYLTNF